MAFINDKLQEINCKIVYYGPPSSGKQTTVKGVASTVDPKRKLSSLRANNPSLYFDFIPIRLGSWKGYTVRLHLYSAPADKGYQSSHQLISTGVDAVIFVADSYLLRAQDNFEALVDLKKALREQHEDVPIIFQYNKRDESDIASVKELRQLLNTNKSLDFESIAIKGKGIMEPVLAAAKQALKNIQLG